MNEDNDLSHQQDIAQQGPLDQQPGNNVPSDYVLFLRIAENVRQNWLFYLITFNILIVGYIVYILFYTYFYHINTLDIKLKLLYSPIFNIVMLNLIYISYFSSIYKIPLSKYGIVKHLAGIKNIKKILFALLISLSILYIGQYLVFSVLLGKLFLEAISNPINPASAYVIGFTPYIFVYGLWGLLAHLSGIASVPLIIYMKKHHVKRLFKTIAFAIIYSFCVQACFSLFFNLSRIKI